MDEIKLTEDEVRVLTTGERGQRLPPKTLKERRGERAETIRSLGAKFKKAGSRWEDESEYQQFRRAAAEMSILDETIEAEQAMLNAEAERLMRGGGAVPGSSAPMFRDTATGRLIRALLPGESIVDADRRERGIGGGTAEPAEPHVAGRMLQAILLNQPDLLNDQERRELLGGVDSSGGYLLGSTLSNRVLDLARSASVMLRGGALTVPLDGAELRLARVASDPTSYWRHEGVAVTASQPTFDIVVLKPRTLACIVPITIELLEDSNNIAQALEMVLQRSMAQALDGAALAGDAAGAEPTGVLNTTGVNTVVVGYPDSYSQFSAAIGDILAANFDGELSRLAWCMHPTDWETVDKMVDTTGQPLQATPWCREPKRLATTALTAGTGIIGDFSQIILGMRTRGGVIIRVLDSGTVVDGSSVTHNAASELKKLVVAYLRADVAVMRPAWQTVLSGILTEEPSSSSPGE